MFLRHLSLAGFRKISRKHDRITKGTQERPSSTIPRKMRPRKRGPNYVPHIIVTLDPNQFAEKKQQLLHIGNLQSFKTYISLFKQSRPVMIQRMLYDPTYEAVTGKHPNYPPNTRAFLYYSTSPEQPRIAGELRLRVASVDNPTSFESGSDLLLRNGHPWSRPLYILSKHYFLLYEKLREDRLVPDDLHTVLSSLPATCLQYRRSQLLYTLNDTFIVDFSHTSWNFLVITEQGLDRLRLFKLFSDRRKTCKGKPYTGSALVRFERSTLPEHKGTRTVVLRFLKIITPVKCVIPLYDGYICCPKEGELHRRTRYTLKSDPSVWRFNIDTSRRGLQSLWDP